MGKRGRKSSVNWDLADWSLRDVDIAKGLGVSRERVRQVRKELGKPKSPMWHKRENTIERQIEAGDWTGMTPGQVAKEVSCTEAYASQLLRDLNKTHVQEDRRRRWKYDWDRVQPQMWREMTDGEIAEFLGVKNPAVVTQWRRRKGIMKQPPRKPVVEDAKVKREKVQ